MSSSLLSLTVAVHLLIQLYASDHICYCDTMLSPVQATLKYLATVRRNDEYEKFKNSRVSHLAKMIAKSKVDIEDYTQCIELIDQSALLDDDSNDKLIKLFNARLSDDSAELDNDSSKMRQVCTAPEKFITQELIDKWEAAGTNWKRMVHDLVDHWHFNLGLKYADVETRKRATATIALYSGLAET